MTKQDERRQTQYSKAIAAMLANATLQAAADDVGVSLRTLQRWMQDADFIAQLHAAQDAMLEQATLRVVGLSGDAVSTLHAAMADPETPTGVRVRSADLLLANALRLSEQVSLAQRVRKLEATQGGIPDAATTRD